MVGGGPAAAGDGPVTSGVAARRWRECRMRAGGGQAGRRRHGAAARDRREAARRGDGAAAWRRRDARGRRLRRWLTTRIWAKLEVGILFGSDLGFGGGCMVGLASGGN
jgi:hypothetical protein